MLSTCTILLACVRGRPCWMLRMYFTYDQQRRAGSRERCWLLLMWAGRLGTLSLSSTARHDALAPYRAALSRSAWRISRGRRCRAAPGQASVSLIPQTRRSSTDCNKPAGFVRPLASLLAVAAGCSSSCPRAATTRHPEGDRNTGPARAAFPAAAAATLPVAHLSTLLLLQMVHH